MRTLRIALVALILGSLLTIAPRAAASVYVPGQFIAKQYSEALGRLPDQSGWSSQANWISGHGCNAGALKDVGSSLYTSGEFTGLGYSNTEKVLALYRGALNREPDQAGLNNYVNLLNTGTPWTDVVNTLFTSSEFTNLVPTICSGVIDGSGSSYYWSTQPVLALTAVGSGFVGTGAELQVALNGAAVGTTVYLARDTVVSVVAPLQIPAGVTLSTTGIPDHYHYAQMARLVRGSTFNDALVYVGNGSGLKNVWVDGKRDQPRNFDATRNNVRVQGGTNTKVDQDRIDNTSGPQSVQVLGAFDGYPCASASVSNNLITAYSSDHYISNAWTDGVASTCEHTTIDGNQIVDSTDVGIVLYRSSPYTGSVIQASTVTNNSLLSAGNAMFGGLAMDPLYETGRATRTYDFTGASIASNTMWSSANTHYQIGLVDGTRAWFGTTADMGTGASIKNNSTGSLSARVRTGIGVSGMLSTTVTGNTMTWVRGAPGRCPDADFAASITAGTASGTFSPAPTDVAFDSCI